LIWHAHMADDDMDTGEERDRDPKGRKRGGRWGLRGGQSPLLILFCGWWACVAVWGWRMRRRRRGPSRGHVPRAHAGQARGAGVVLCDGCGEREPRFCCDRCSFARYCSPECQRDHWAACHRDECALHHIRNQPMLSYARRIPPANAPLRPPVIEGREELKRAMIFYSTENVAQHVSRLKRAAEIARMCGPDHFVIGEACRLLSVHSLRRVRGADPVGLSEAFDYIEEALSSAEQMRAYDLERSVLIIRCLVTRGCANRMRGNLNSVALRDFMEALKMARKIGSQAEEATVLAHVGIIRVMCGDLHGSESVLAQSLDLWRKIIWHSTENFDKSAGTTSAALHVHISPHESLKCCANTAHNLGSVLLLLGKQKLAEAAFAEALEMCHEIRDLNAQCLVLAVGINGCVGWDERSQAMSSEFRSRLIESRRSQGDYGTGLESTGQCTSCVVCKHAVKVGQLSEKIGILPCCFRMFHKKCFDLHKSSTFGACPHIKDLMHT